MKKYIPAFLIITALMCMSVPALSQSLSNSQSVYNPEDTLILSQAGFPLATCLSVIAAERDSRTSAQPGCTSYVRRSFNNVVSISRTIYHQGNATCIAQYNNGTPVTVKGVGHCSASSGDVSASVTPR
jgi:hypothetical protein